MATEQEDTTPAAAFSLQTIHLHGLGIPHGSMCTVTLRGMGRGEEEDKPGRGGGCAYTLHTLLNSQHSWSGTEKN